MTKSRLLKRKLDPFLLLIPALVIVIVLIIWPIIKTFSYSVTSYSPLVKNSNVFTGLDNFKEVFQDKVFKASISFSVLYTVTVVVFQFLFGLISALLMDNMKRMKGIYRTLVFLPWALSGVLTAVAWKLMFNGDYGAVNDLLLRSGILDKGITWAAKPATSRIMVIVASVWRGVPYFAINMLAALSTIPHDVKESAYVDGATNMQMFFRIILPYLKETIVLTTLLRFIWTFNDVDLVYSMTAGGPNNATLTLPVYVTRNVVDYLNYGYGSSLAVILFVVLLIFTLLYLQLGKDSGDFSG